MSHEQIHELNQNMQEAQHAKVMSHEPRAMSPEHVHELNQKHERNETRKSHES